MVSVTNTIASCRSNFSQARGRLAPPFVEGDRRLCQARSTHCSALGEARRNASAPTSSYQRQHGVCVSRRNRHLANCVVQSIRL